MSLLRPLRPRALPRTPALHRRTLLTAAPKPFAFAFDIDGVLLHGRTPIAPATPSLHLLAQHSIPFLLLTNGGGLPESRRVADLTARLSFPFSVSQFIQSHTPFQGRKYAGATTGTILAVGGDNYGENVRAVAEAYGFPDVVTPADIAARWRGSVPFTGRETGYEGYAGMPRRADVAGKRVEAVYVFNDPRDWGCDLQIIIDVLLSEDGVIGTRRKSVEEVIEKGHPRLVFSNPDLWWSNEHPHNRLGQGGFKAALEGVWSAVTGGKGKLKYEVIGKPHQETYEYAEDVLVGMKGGEGVKRVYMVGDNPESDIRGANGFRSLRGVEWKSVLVESGVWKRGDETRDAGMIVKDVGEAVRRVLEIEGVKV